MSLPVGNKKKRLCDTRVITGEFAKLIYSFQTRLVSFSRKTKIFFFLIKLRYNVTVAKQFFRHLRIIRDPPPLTHEKNVIVICVMSLWNTTSQTKGTLVVCTPAGPPTRKGHDDWI